MAKFVQYERIVLFQRRNGWVCDLGPGSALAPVYRAGEEYFDSGAGTKKPIARDRSLVITCFDEDKMLHLRKMWHEGCEVRAILIAGGTNLVWEMDSAMNFVENGASTGGLSTC